MIVYLISTWFFSQAVHPVRGAFPPSTRLFLFSGSGLRLRLRCRDRRQVRVASFPRSLFPFPRACFTNHVPEPSDFSIPARSHQPSREPIHSGGGQWLLLEMAQHYSSNGRRSSPYHGFGSSNAYRPKSHRRNSDSSLLDDLKAFVAYSIRSLWQFWNERGRYLLLAAMVSFLRGLRKNLTYDRLFSFPHLLVVLWVFTLIWGERWVFHSKVESCHWQNWEKWVCCFAVRALWCACCGSGAMLTVVCYL